MRTCSFLSLVYPLYNLRRKAASLGNAVLKKNKAVYTAASVACFWAGAATLLIATSAKTAFSYQFGLFLVACMRLYKSLCRSVCRSVRTPSTKTSQIGTIRRFQPWRWSVMLLPLPKSTQLMLPCIRPCFWAAASIGDEVL